MMEKIKKISCVAIAIVVLVSIACIPAFAYTDTSLNGISFEDQPIPVESNTGTDAEIFNKGFIIGSYIKDGYLSEIAVFSLDSDKVYAFVNPDGTTYRYYLVSSEPFNFLRITRNTKLSNNYITYGKGTYQTVLNTTNTPNMYRNDTTMTFSNGATNYQINVPSYTNYQAGIEAVTDWINNPPVAGTTAPFSYNIAPGYALFVDIHGLTGVSGNLTTSTTQAFASPHTSNQTISYQSTIPSGNIAPQGNGINWEGTGNKDLFGRYKSWTRSLILNPNSSFIAIYNPVHVNSYLDPEHEDFNGTIHVSVSSAYASTSILVPLNTELTASGQVGTTTTDDQKPMQYDSNTNTWYPTNQDGTPYTPSPYGDYMPATTNSIHDWLKNIANLISGFFEGAIGAVTTLVNAGSAFIHQLISLYSWLPAPVYAVLSSALILVITIGVIKVFI